MIRHRGKSRVSVLLIVTDGELDDQNLAAKAVSAAHFCHVDNHHVDNESVNVLVINTLQLTLNTYNANIYYYIHIIYCITYNIIQPFCNVMFCMLYCVGSCM